ncbi:MAG TPA: cell division protein FtsQ [Flammeovirgaceae bacterium]|nr:cell division protein FtsQ [Flammeovirgaceae bacterium]
MSTRKILAAVLGVVTLTLLIAFSGGNDRRVCNKVLINIDNQLNNHFVDNTDVMRLLTDGFTRQLEGALFADINVRQLEKKLLLNPYIREAEIYRDLRGHLLVQVGLRRPMARIVQAGGADAYIAEDGTILPVSDKFSARVLTISGKQVAALTATENIAKSDFRPLYELVAYINRHDFWRAQIAQIELLDNGEVRLWPQVTKQYIEFGKPEKLTDKFKRLRVFYKDILPRKGWNTYKRVNVKYSNQIICE